MRLKPVRGGAGMVPRGEGGLRRKAEYDLHHQSGGAQGAGDGGPEYQQRATHAPHPLQISKSTFGVSLISGSTRMAFFTQAFAHGLQGIF